jgi:hypothetical protein
MDQGENKEMSEIATPPPAKAEPLFVLDLGSNGGRLAPTSFEELDRWIGVEQNFWSWTQQRNYGNHESTAKEAMQALQNAQNYSQQGQQQKSSNPQHAQQQLEACKSQIQEAFVQRKLPHTSTPLAKRVEAYRKEVSDKAASFLLSTLITPVNGRAQYQVLELDGWRGMVEGLIERFQLGSAPAKGRKQAADQSFEQLREKAEQLVGEKTEAYESLHREYLELAESIRLKAAEQTTNFAKGQGERQDAFEQLTEEHKQALEALRKTFREELALRAPAEYWDKKRKGHRLWASVTGGLSFLGIGGAAVGLGWQIHDLLQNTPLGSTPETWRLAVLALIGVFSVWALRLVVRMFLSHLHLLTDAGERVVMVQTYLSLLEGDRLSSKEDRQLILQALFRPASDGIVKDEGVPFSLVEMLTRTGKA